MKGIFPALFLLVILVQGCSDNHFITDRSYRQKVEKQFAIQKELAKNRTHQLFDIFDEKLTTREREALQFIYAYSSLNDLADYDGSFFLQNVRSSFAARDTFSWGKTVPENLFRHFVLPVRINNENLDSSRWVFFNELKDRIKPLPMKAAVLEVNHWCHEKVTYKGTDIRTSSPLATVKTAFGRCGEESTLTVAALRSVGIPARQCYTPRWAHCDDNHAWVEVWVDGKWHFIGACEPDADLDVAWFTKPAKRAMLVNTTVFGDYEGPEDVLVRDPLFTRINVLENYAPTRLIFARVFGSDNKPADSAIVEFQLYNYAEFYPLHKTFTNKEGLCSFRTGYGDLLVRAAKGALSGFDKLNVREKDTVTIRLSQKTWISSANYIDFIPPEETEIQSVVPDSTHKLNEQKLALEDKLRSSYEATFIDSVKSYRFAKLVNLNPDTLWYFLHKSRGNWRELTGFITGLNSSDRDLVFPLFDNISEKDLRDADPEVLSEVVNTWQKNLPAAVDKNESYKYILSPRVDNEWLKPYRSLFLKSFESGFIENARNDPAIIAEWIKKNISCNNSGNYSRAPITPEGVFELRMADSHSADIFFVAVSRSFGIASRLDPTTKIPQFFANGKWNDIFIFNKKPSAEAKGLLELTNHPDNGKKPEYTTHYTIGTHKDGFYQTLDYEGSPLVSTFPCTLEVPAGPAMMVTGTRLTNGTVLAKILFFDVKAGDKVTQPVELRKVILSEKTYGKINMELLPKNLNSNCIIVWIDPEHEPAKHFVSDLQLKKREFSNWKGKIFMVCQDENQMKEFTKKEAGLLPGNISYSFEKTFPVQISDIKLNSSNPKKLPFVIFVKQDGSVIYFSEGYKIGATEELLSLLAKE